MEQNIRLSKNQIRNAKKKAAQELRKLEKTESESILSSQGKVITSTIKPSKQKHQLHEELQEKIEKIQETISHLKRLSSIKAKSKGSNEFHRDQNNDLSYQRISSLKTNWQRKNSSQSNHNKISNTLKK